MIYKESLAKTPRWVFENGKRNNSASTNIFFFSCRRCDALGKLKFSFSPKGGRSHSWPMNVSSISRADNNESAAPGKFISPRGALLPVTPTLFNLPRGDFKCLPWDIINLDFP